MRLNGYYITYRMITEPPEAVRRLTFNDYIDFRVKLIRMIYDRDYFFISAGRLEDD